MKVCLHFCPGEKVLEVREGDQNVHLKIELQKLKKN